MGFIKINREIQNSWIFEDNETLKKFMLMAFRVNYKDSKTKIGNKLYDVKIGQCALSLSNWGVVLGCGKKSVINFFNLLESEGIIKRKTIGKGNRSSTLITIDTFIDFNTTKEPQTTPQTTPKGNRKGTANGIQLKKVRKEESKNNKYTPPEFLDFKNYAIQKMENVDLHKLKLKYESWIENDWRNGNDKKIKNWKSTLLNTLPYLKKDTLYSEKNKKITAAQNFKNLITK